MSGSASIDLRPAAPADAARIVELVRAGFAPSLLELFVYGCHGAERYVAAQIDAASRGGDTRYTVAVKKGAAAVGAAEHGASRSTGPVAIGCIEMRVLPDRLFLNYVAVDSAARSTKVGSRLLAAAVAASMEPRHRRMALDVLADNLVARRWYEGLGFCEEGATEWWTMPLPRTEAASPAIVSGLPQAEACQRVFGFSRLTVATGEGAYEVGLLGDRWFRVTHPAALADRELAAALERLDPSRRLLALLPSGALAEPARARATRVAVTLRLAVDLADLRERLERAAASRAEDGRPS